MRYDAYRMRANLQPPEAVAASVAFFFSLGDGRFGRVAELAELNKHQLKEEAFVAAFAVMQIAFVGQIDGLIEPRVGAAVGHRAVLLADAGADLEEY